MKRLVEIRAYALKAGTRSAFHEVVTTQAMPMLMASGFDVVAFGPSLHDADAYYLIRAFANLADHDEQEERFYGSQAWRGGPREAIVSRIERYLDTLLWLNDGAIDAMRNAATQA